MVVANYMEIQIPTEGKNPNMVYYEQEGSYMGCTSKALFYWP